MVYQTFCELWSYFVVGKFGGRSGSFCGALSLTRSIWSGGLVTETEKTVAEAALIFMFVLRQKLTKCSWGIVHILLLIISIITTKNIRIISLSTSKVISHIITIAITAGLIIGIFWYTSELDIQNPGGLEAPLSKC